MTLRRAARRISQRYDEILEPTGMRATQFAILATLAEAEGLQVHELADRMDLDRTTMGKNLRPLQRDGLVAVGVSETDRRGRAIALTTSGRERLGQALPLWIAAQEAVDTAHGRKRMKGLREELRGLRLG
jgi:DNA-binding MarR family transcriptional regulator